LNKIKPPQIQKQNYYLRDNILQGVPEKMIPYSFFSNSATVYNVLFLQYSAS